MAKQDFDLPAEASKRQALSFLQRIEKSLDVASSGMKERHHLRIDSYARFLELYREERCWLVCDLEIRSGGADHSALLARANCKGIVRADLPASGVAEFYRGQLNGGDKQPVFIDISEFIDDPQGVSTPVFICLDFIKMFDEIGREGKRLASNLAFEPCQIVGEGKGHFRRIAPQWLNYGTHDIIQHASKVADGIAYDGVEVATAVMKALKMCFDPMPPFIRLKSNSIQFWTSELGDTCFKIRNMFACPFQLQPGI